MLTLAPIPRTTPLTLQQRARSAPFGSITVLHFLINLFPQEMNFKSIVVKRASCGLTFD